MFYRSHWYKQHDAGLRDCCIIEILYSTGSNFTITRVRYTLNNVPFLTASGKSARFSSFNSYLTPVIQLSDPSYLRNVSLKLTWPQLFNLTPIILVGKACKNLCWGWMPARLERSSGELAVIKSKNGGWGRLSSVRCQRACLKIAKLKSRLYCWNLLICRADKRSAIRRMKHNGCYGVGGVIDNLPWCRHKPQHHWFHSRILPDISYQRHCRAGQRLWGIE